MRWGKDDLEAFEARRKKWDETGTVRTHTLGIKNESNPKQKRYGKYHNIKTEAHGLKFDSKKEQRRWEALRRREMDGEISDLKHQARYSLNVNGAHVCDYIADFTYTEAGELVVEDAKGVRTPVFELKAKLMKAVHGIEVRLS